MRDKINEIYTRKFEEVNERFVELGFIRQACPKLEYDESQSTKEMKSYVAKEWESQDQLNKLTDALDDLKWDTDRYFIHYNVDCEYGQSPIAINEIAIRVFSELHLLELEEVIEIALLYVIFKWFLHNSINDKCNVWSDEAMNKEDSESKEFMITWSQLLIYKMIETMPKMVNAFNYLNSVQSPHYFIWKVIKDRSFKDIVHDMVSIKQSSEYSLSKWREIMQNNSFWLSKFCDSMCDKKQVDRFFDESNLIIAIWFEKGKLNYENDLLPFIKRAGNELDMAFFDRISLSDYSFDGARTALKIHKDTEFMKRLSYR